MFPRSTRILLGLLGGFLPLVSLGGLVSIGGIAPQSGIPAAYSSQCALVFPFSFYEGQSFKAYEGLIPGTLGSSWEILDSSNVRIFNPYGALGNTLTSNTLNGLLPSFVYKSNGRPGTNHFNFGGIGTVLAYQQNNDTYTIKPTPTPSRTAIAGQIVHNLYRRQIKSWGSLTNIYTMSYVGLNTLGGSFTSNPSDRYTPMNDYECQNFYIAKCGDGVQDNPNKIGNASTNGKLGILINGAILPWKSLAPAEECDGTDGAPVGYTCDSSCKLVQTILQPTCTIAPAQQTTSCGQNAVLNFNSTNTTSVSNLVNISGGIIAPNQAGRFNVSPTQTTTYSFTVNGMAGSTPAVCTATVNVTPAAQPDCTLTPAQQTITAGQNAILNFNSTYTTTISNLLNISGSIIAPNQAGRFNVSPIQTTNYSFTVNGGACTVPKVCTATVTVLPALQPVLHITKTLINDIAYHSGDLIGFKIQFSNTGTGTAHHVVLKDTLPLSLAYVSSSLQGVVPPYTLGTYLSGSNTVVEYSGFDLAPGQTGEMIITGRLLSYALCSYVLNYVSLSSLELPTIYGADDFYCYTPTTNLSIVKTINKNVFSLGENIQFAITVTNNGPDIASDVKIGDLRPNMNCILPGASYTSNYPLQTGSNPNATYFRTLIPQLPVGQSLIINLSGTVANTPSCAGSYLNTGTLSYVTNGQTRTGIAYVPFVVGTIQVAFTKTIVQQSGSRHGDTITFALDYVNNGNTPISSYSVIDYRPSALSFVSSTPMQYSQVFTAGGSLIKWNFTTPLQPGATGRIIIYGKIN